MADIEIIALRYGDGSATLPSASGAAVVPGGKPCGQQVSVIMAGPGPLPASTIRRVPLQPEAARLTLEAVK